jgi:hypothetical protein
MKEHENKEGKGQELEKEIVVKESVCLENGVNNENINISNTSIYFLEGEGNKKELEKENKMEMNDEADNLESRCLLSEGMVESQKEVGVVKLENISINNVNNGNNVDNNSNNTVNSINVNNVNIFNNNILGESIVGVSVEQSSIVIFTITKTVTSSMATTKGKEKEGKKKKD